MELKKTFLKYFKIFLHLQKIGLMSRTAYRANFFIIIFAVLIQASFSLIFIKVVFGFLNNISGWNYYEALVIVATYLIVEGLMWVLFGQFNTIVKQIQQGELDGLIVRPIDTQFLVSVWRGDSEDIVRIITGLGVIVYALNNLNLTLTQITVNSFFYIFMLFNALVITYSLAVLFKTISIWTIEARAFFHLTDSFSRMSQYPTDIFYHKIVQTIATVIIPLFFMATVPAKILTRGFDLKIVLSSFIIAGVFFYISRKFFQFALTKYESASS
ncbi:hypothetical protein HOD96_01470 [Candidatus Falkowbacteria bacterium]|nr:hypothetical protein [Candidatus Falkowbacteria bacterium]MBT4433403.1 hypothetical protein [Candidatus Falkowbacteria bacterium]